jgi:hypothetical protein
MADSLWLPVSKGGTAVTRMKSPSQSSISNASQLQLRFGFIRDVIVFSAIIFFAHIMMKLVLLLLLSTASAFVVQPRQAFQTSVKMFTTDEEPRALKTMDEPEEEEAPAVALEATTIVKDMNTGEVKKVKWTDPAMEAHTK